VEVSQQKADEDEDARKSPEDHFHDIIYLLPSPATARSRRQDFPSMLLARRLTKSHATLIVNLQLREPRLAPETILCSNRIESSLEITRTYGPQMFVARLRIQSAR
jgi:hypothetical protein